MSTSLYNPILTYLLYWYKIWGALYLFIDIHSLGDKFYGFYIF